MTKRITVSAICVVLLVVVGYLVKTSVGKPMSTDLSVIGQGKPVLALAYENFSPAGGDALNRLRKVRGDYDSRLEFVVADLGAPPGRAFADRYQLVDGLAVFLTRDGQPLQVTSIPADEQELRGRLDTLLNSAE